MANISWLKGMLAGSGADRAVATTRYHAIHVQAMAFVKASGGAFRGSRSTCLVVTTLSLCLSNTLQIDPRLSLVTSPAKRRPIFWIVGAAQAQRYYVIILHLLQWLVAGQAPKTLQL
jgi:hypothetical protein